MEGEIMVEEYLPGEEYTVDILADSGNPLLVIPRLREQIKLGVSFRGKVIKDQEIIDYSKKIVNKLKLHGLVGLQFKRDKNKIPKILESNPRLQGTNVLSAASGVNLPYLAVKLLLGEKFEVPEPKWGTGMVRYWGEIFYDENGFPLAF